MKSITKFFPFIVLFFAIASTAKVQAYTQDSTATIYIMRPTVIGAAMKIPVSINGQDVGKLGSLKYIKYTVPAGAVSVKAKMENADEVEIQAEAGKMYYVKMAVVPGIITVRISLKELTFEESAPILSKCKEQGEGKAKDKSKRVKEPR